MSIWAVAATLAGGIGLFLLGMTMMSDGLRLAAGPSLERILRGATRTPWRRHTPRNSESAGQGATVQRPGAPQSFVVHSGSRIQRPSASAEIKCG